MANKKITQVESPKSSASGEGQSGVSPKFVASQEAKDKATNTRIFAFIMFLLAIGCEVAAIIFLKKTPINMILLIAFIVVDAIFAIIGSQLWKKANRLDPASEKQKFKFFVQSQLGAIMAVIAFLPLVILIFTNKDLKGKQKAILGGVGIAALLIAGLLGADFNPPSVEQYSEQIAAVETLTGQNLVYWTKSGTKYHLYSDCYTINSSKTEEIFEGGVEQARELKNITELCKICEQKATKK